MKYISNKELLNAFKEIGLKLQLKTGEYLNIARPDGMHCEFYPNNKEHYAFMATYTINGKEQDLDFIMSYDLPTFVLTVCKILKYKPKTIDTKDVVRITKGKLKDKTGVVNRPMYNTINVFVKGNEIGTWFDRNELKRIGRVK